MNRKDPCLCKKNVKNTKKSLFSCPVMKNVMRKMHIVFMLQNTMQRGRDDF